MEIGDVVDFLGAFLGLPQIFGMLFQDMVDFWGAGNSSSRGHFQNDPGVCLRHPGRLAPG